jgi:hypothetical protein
VFGGMLAGTFLGVVFIPLFFVAVLRLSNRLAVKQAPFTGKAGPDMEAPSHGD